MNTPEPFSLIDDILARWRDCLGADFTAYANHCHRVARFCLALRAGHPEVMAKIAIAAAFHDLGIWTDKTFDYLGPSRRLARSYLAQTGREGWRGEIEAMIEYHHKITKYTANPDWLAEDFRKADWIDVSSGWLRFGLSPAFVKEIMARFPNAGFHARLVDLTWRRLRSNPLNPLPMLKI